MKNKGIIIFLIMLAIVIVAVMVGDWYSKRPDNMKGNKFAYSVDEFKNVPDELIHYKETKNFKIGFEKPAGLTIAKNKIYIVGDKKIKIIDRTGKLINEFNLPAEPHTLEAVGDKIYIAFEKQILVYDEYGIIHKDWGELEENTYLTAIAAFDENIFVADAGTRRILRFNFAGELQNEFEGKPVKMCYMVL
jgi:hypothetical protein